MPLFSHKFSTKKTPLRNLTTYSSLQRKLNPDGIRREFGLATRPVKLKLGNKNSVFEDGNWIVDEEEPDVYVEFLQNKEWSNSLIEKKELTEQNNYLKFKIDLLINMVMPKVSKFMAQEKEIEELKAKLEGLK